MGTVKQRAFTKRKLMESAAQQCAPVIFGIKPSNLLIIDRDTAFALKSLIDATGLKIRCLSPYTEKQVWFMFRESSLDVLLMDQEKRAFIEAFGYSRIMSRDEILTRLCCRFQAYKRGEIGFPHELGVFLGYPMCDVRGFIENHGKNYLYSGYWKVYANEKEARRIFRNYENVRNYALSLVEQGIGFSQLRQQTVFSAM